MTAVLQRQLERYVELGVAALAGIDDGSLRDLAAPLVADHDVAAEPNVDGRLRRLLVLHRAFVPAERLLPLVAVGGQAGYVDMTPSSPGAFGPLEGLDIPGPQLYVVHDFDCGDELRNLPPSVAVARIRESGREPVTIDEGVSAVVLYPELLRRGHAFSLAASRSLDQRVRKGVPALWMSRGAPRLGWCWDGNPHPWLGTASCAGRGS